MKRLWPVAALLAAVCGVELIALRQIGEQDPAAYRMLLLGSCAVVIVLWFLSHQERAAPTPRWPDPPNTDGGAAWDPRTRELARLLEPGAPASTGDDLGTILLAADLSDRDVSPDLGRYLAALRAGGLPKRPSAERLTAWLTEVEP